MANSRIQFERFHAFMEIQLTLACLILKNKFEPSKEDGIELIETTVTLTTKNDEFCKALKIEQ